MNSLKVNYCNENLIIFIHEFVSEVLFKLLKQDHWSDPSLWFCFYHRVCGQSGLSHTLQLAAKTAVNEDFPHHSLNIQIHILREPPRPLLEITIKGNVGDLN